VSVNVTISGTTYAFPTNGEQDWGTVVTNWAVAVSSQLLQRTGGNFSLTNDVNFGATFATIQTYLKSRTGSIADAGFVRMARTDTVSWRNQAGGANLALGVDSSNRLTFNGHIIIPSTGVIQPTEGGTGISSYTTGDTLYASAANVLSKLSIGTANYVYLSDGSIPGWGQIVNASVDASAAIAYSKLNLAGSIVNADVNASAAIAYSKLALTGSIVNADINASAAIAYSKLNLSGSIVNADVNASAAIARTKIASGTNYRILANSSSGVMSENAALTNHRVIVADTNGQLANNAALTAGHVIYADSNGELAGEAQLSKSRGGTGADNSSVTFPSSGTIPTIASTSTLTNKTFGDAVLMTQVSTPATPSSGLDYIYFKSDDNLYYKTSSGSENQLITSTSAEPRNNFIYNSRFLLWQRGTSVTCANAATAYQADRWYVKNSLGTNGVLTFSRVSSSDTGAVYDASVKITTAPTAGQTNGCELYQTLENADTLQLYGQTASFSIRVKALGNVNQVGVQFYYKTTEAKVDTAIGSEQTVSVSTGSYATATISGQALGTSMTTSGTVGVRVRITGVSSGNTYDLNNGFLVTAAILNIGNAPSTFQPKHKAFQCEVSDCERFYQKSFNLNTAPGADTTGQVRYRSFSAGNDAGYTSFLHTRMRTTPTITIYNPTTGGTGSGRTSGGANSSSTVQTIGECAFETIFTSIPNTEFIAWHWVADGEI